MKRKNKIFERKLKILNWVVLSVITGVCPLLIGAGLAAIRNGVFSSWANGFFFLALSLFVEVLVITSNVDFLSILLNRFSIFGVILSTVGVTATICLSQSDYNATLTNWLSGGACAVSIVVALSANVREWRLSEKGKR